MKKMVGIFALILISGIISCSNSSPGVSSAADSLVNGRNVNLANVVISAGNIVFNADTTTYNIEVQPGIDSFTMLLMPADPKSTITVNGNDAENSVTVNLNFGLNTILIEVTSDDKKASKTYTLSVNRLNDVSHNANLSGLAISAGTLSSAFNPDTTIYTAEISDSTSSISVTPVTASDKSSIKINGDSVNSSSSWSMNLNSGNNIILVVVTAEDGTTKKTYNLVVTKLALSSNANLSSLIISAGGGLSLDKNTYTYSVEVPYSVESVTVNPTAAGIGALIDVNSQSVISGTASQQINLLPGSNTISILVTAEDGTYRTYSVTVYRLAASTNSNLTGLTISAGTLTPEFTGNTTGYSTTIPYLTTSTTVTPTSAGLHAVIKVNGTTVVSGIASEVINLSIGVNIITVFVTAESGDTKTYIITLTRLGLNTNANLSGLYISAGTLNPSAFDPDTLSYSTDVTYKTASTTVTPTVVELNASVTVNGTAVISGTASGSINLTPGENIITIVVTAESGVTKTYTVTVNSNFWVQLASVSGPERFAHSAIYDGNGNMIIFGGYGSGNSNNIWKYNIASQSWTELASSGPSIRLAHSAIYDGNGNMIIFGGQTTGVNTRLNDVWSYNIASQTWTQLASSSGPSARISHSAIYDGNGNMIILGGLNNSGNFLNDVWRYNIASQTWTQLASSSGLSARMDHSAIYDNNGSMIIFGGRFGSNVNNYLNDVWKYNILNQTWTQIETSSGPWPSARSCHRAIYDENGGMIIFGIEGDSLSDVWMGTLQ